MIKNFKFEQNQALWNFYEDLKEKEGSTKVSTQQYKPACLALETFTEGKFEDITAKQLDNFINSKIIRNTTHIRGFLLTVITKGELKVSKDVLAYLIPAEYKRIVELLIA